jgi:hypothetical protein
MAENLADNFGLGDGGDDPQRPRPHAGQRPPLLSPRAVSGRNTTRATLGKGLAVSAFPLYVPV